MGTWDDSYCVRELDSMYRFTLLEADRFFFLVRERSGLKVHLARRLDCCCFSANRDVLRPFYAPFVYPTWNLTVRSGTPLTRGTCFLRCVSDSQLSWFSAASVVRIELLATDCFIFWKGDLRA